MDTMDDDNETQKSSIASDVIFLTASKITASLNVILLFVLLSHTLSIQDYGSFRQVWLINKGFVLEIFALGIPISLFYFLPKLAKGKRRFFVVQTLLLLTSLGFLVAAAIYIFSGLLASVFNNPELERLLRITSFYALFTLPTLALEGVLVSFGKTVVFSVYTIIDRILLLGIIAASVYLFGTIDALCITLVVFGFSEFVVSTLIIRFSLKSYPIESRTFNVVEQLRFSLPSGLSNVIGILNIELDKVVISSFFNVAQFAKYANGAIEVPFLGTVAASVNSVLMPEYVRRHASGDDEGILRLWHKSVYKVALVFFPLAVFLFIFADDIITLLFSEKYLESSTIFRIYLLALLPKVTWYGIILIALGYSREPFYGSLFSLIANLVLNFTLIHVVGFTGPAVATTLTTYLISFYYLHRIRAVFDKRWSDIFPWRVLAKIFLISAFLGLALCQPLSYFYTGNVFIKLILGFSIFSIPLYSFFRHTDLIIKSDIELFRQKMEKLSLFSHK